LHKADLFPQFQQTGSMQNVVECCLSRACRHSGLVCPPRESVCEELDSREESEGPFVLPRRSFSAGPTQTAAAATAMQESDLAAQVVRKCSFCSRHHTHFAGPESTSYTAVHLYSRVETIVQPLVVFLPSFPFKRVCQGLGRLSAKLLPGPPAQQALLIRPGSSITTPGAVLQADRKWWRESKRGREHDFVCWPRW